MNSFNRLTATGHCELYGPHEFLLLIDSAAHDAAGNPTLHIEESCADPVAVETERDRLCAQLGLTLTAWSMPDESLRVNLLPRDEAITVAATSRRMQRKHHKRAA